MRGHWLSSTRKLNKHYQSGSRAVPVPLWDFALANFGGGVNGRWLTLDKDGIWVTSSSGRGTWNLQSVDVSTFQGTKFPYMWFCFNGVELNGSSVPNLANLGISDTSNTLKVMEDTLTFTYVDSYSVTHTRTEKCYVVYVDLVDLPMRNQTHTQPTQYTNIKFGGRFILPQSNPLTLAVHRSDLPLEYYDGSQYKTDGVGAYNLSRTYFYDSTLLPYVAGTPVDIGGTVNTNKVMYLDESIYRRGTLTDIIMGGCAVGTDPLPASNGVDSQGNIKDAVFSDYGVFEYALTLGALNNMNITVTGTDFTTYNLKTPYEELYLRGSGQHTNTIVTGWT